LNLISPVHQEDSFCFQISSLKYFQFCPFLCLLLSLSLHHFTHGFIIIIPPNYFISLLTFVVLGLEIRALCLLVKCSATGSTVLT
jgi:hypothetical protein